MLDVWLVGQDDAETMLHLARLPVAQFTHALWLAWCREAILVCRIGDAVVWSNQYLSPALEQAIAAAVEQARELGLEAATATVRGSKTARLVLLEILDTE